MQNKLNNHPDAFSDFVRQKLENHSLPVDPNNWKEIEARLDSGKRIIPLWSWLSGGAAVALLAVLFTILHVSDSNHTIVKTNPTGTHQTVIQIKPTRKDNSQIANKTGKDSKIWHISKSFTGQIQSTGKTGIPPQNALIDSMETKKSSGNLTALNRNIHNEVAAEPTGKRDSVSQYKAFVSNSLADDGVNKPVRHNKNKAGWLLAAAVSSNGNVLSGNDSPVGIQYTMSNVTSHAGNPTSFEFSNINYSPPISAGLLIRKNFNGWLGVESGLVYTYLLTTFESNTTQRNDTKLHLHYIGIPLNLVARIWGNTKWELYVSGGGMAEKGIESVYVLNQNGVGRTTTNSKIDGLQWSTSGAVGTTYKIQRNIGIYFEPKIAYYFDNQQPLSARTEYPVVIGLAAGVRFQFK